MSDRLLTERELTGVLQRLQTLEKRVARLEALEHPRYTFGTFTPSFTGTSTAGTFTYVPGRRDGRYTRIGDKVDFAIEIAISAITVAPVGDMRITGLPFTAAGSQDGAVTFGLVANINMTAAALMLTGFIPSGATYIDLREMFDNAGSTAYPAANFTNANAQIRLVGTYWVMA